MGPALGPPIAAPYYGEAAHQRDFLSNMPQNGPLVNRHIPAVYAVNYIHRTSLVGVWLTRRAIRKALLVHAVLFFPRPHNTVCEHRYREFAAFLDERLFELQYFGVCANTIGTPLLFLVFTQPEEGGILQHPKRRLGIPFRGCRSYSAHIRCRPVVRLPLHQQVEFRRQEVAHLRTRFQMQAVFQRFQSQSQVVPPSVSVAPATVHRACAH